MKFNWPWFWFALLFPLGIGALVLFTTGMAWDTKIVMERVGILPVIAIIGAVFGGFLFGDEL